MKIVDLAKHARAALRYQRPTKRLLNFCGAYYSPYYNLFRLVAHDMKDEGIAIELGVDMGRGSYGFLLGGMDVIGIDHTRKPGIAIVEHEFPNNFTFLETDTLPVPKVIRANPPKIACLHVDTEHTWSMAAAEFDSYKPYLIEGAVVFFDDLNAADYDVYNYFMTLGFQRLVINELHPECGFGMIIYNSDFPRSKAL